MNTTKAIKIGALSLACALALVGCSSGKKQPTKVAASAAASGTKSTKATPKSSPSAKADPKVQAAVRPTGSPSPLVPLQNHNPDLPLEATVTPSCANQGDTVTLKVKSQPRSAVAYQALYSDGYSGAKPPLGGGYGGNEGGETDKNGLYTATWLLANNPPAGPVRVEVYVFTYENGNGYKSLSFTVGC